MAWADIIPEIWAQRSVALVRKAQTARALVNTSYEGEIAQMGDTVHIIGEGPVTINAYTGADVAEQVYAPTDTTLVADQMHAYNVVLPKVETSQAAGSHLDNIQSRGAYGLADASDTYVYGLHAGAGFNSFETATTPWTIGASGAGVPALFASIVQQARDNNIEANDLVFVAPPILEAGLNLFFQTIVQTTGGDQVRSRGFIGKHLGLNVVISNNLDDDGTAIHGLVFPRGMGIAQADNIVDVKIQDRDNNFGNKAMGLYVFGGKVYDATRVIDVNLDPALLT